MTLQYIGPTIAGNVQAQAAPTLHWRSGALAVFFTLCFIALANVVENGGALDTWEDRLLLAIHSMRSEQLTSVLNTVDLLHGPALAAWVLGGSAICCWHRRWDQLALLLSVALGGGIIARLSKVLVARERPDVERILGASGFSFPSGHTIGVALLAAWAIYMLISEKVSAPMRWVLGAIAVGLVFAVAASRVYMGVHYPSDVIGSMLAAAAWTSVCIAVFTHIRYVRRVVK